MPDPDKNLEYAQAEMPDGRLLLIERERAPRLAARTKTVLGAAFPIAALGFAILIAQAAPVFTFAGLWSFIPLACAYAALSVFTLLQLMSWASRPPQDPANCVVVGMDCSTQELIDVASGRTASELMFGSLH